MQQVQKGEETPVHYKKSQDKKITAIRGEAGNTSSKLSFQSDKRGCAAQ